MSEPGDERTPLQVQVVTADDFARRSTPVRAPSSSEAEVLQSEKRTSADGAAGDRGEEKAGDGTAALGRHPSGEVPELWRRGAARAVDVVIFILLATLIRYLGPLAAMAYLLLGDALFEGASVGKRLFGLRVRRLADRRPGGYFESLLRNAPLGVAGLLGLIPLVGWLLFLTLGAAVVLFETYMVWRDERGMRAGDILAGTRVVDDRGDRS